MLIRYFSLDVLFQSLSDWQGKLKQPNHHPDEQADQGIIRIFMNILILLFYRFTKVLHRVDPYIQYHQKDMQSSNFEEPYPN